MHPFIIYFLDSATADVNYFTQPQQSDAPCSLEGHPSPTDLDQAGTGPNISNSVTVATVVPKNGNKTTKQAAIIAPYRYSNGFQQTNGQARAAPITLYRTSGSNQAAQNGRSATRLVIATTPGSNFSFMGSRKPYFHGKF